MVISSHSMWMLDSEEAPLSALWIEVFPVTCYFDSQIFFPVCMVKWFSGWDMLQLGQPWKRKARSLSLYPCMAAGVGQSI